MSTSPFILRWGIVGCGRISGTFVKDLVLSPGAAAGTSSDVAHAVIACGSRTLAKAEDFIAQFCPEGAYAQKAGLVVEKPEAKGSYDEVLNHKDVDIIYIGTPHTSHFEDAQAALQAGKHVLLEKPATLNKAEFAVLASLAQSKKLFLMEAVWTRFFPLTYALQDLLFKQKVIGDIKRVVSDFSIDFVHVVDESHRMRNPQLAGGGLLDLGPYPLVWAMMILYHHPDNKLAPPSRVTASMIKHPESGVDLFTDFTLDFPNIGARANLSTSIVLNSPKDVVTRIQGTEGEVLLPWATARPDKFTVRRSQIGRGAQDYTEEVHEFPIEGMGLHWEADAVARSIRDGETENPRMPLKETLLTMEILDEVRKQGGYVFPPGLEKIQAS